MRCVKTILLLAAVSRLVAAAQLSYFQAGVGGVQLGTIAVGDIVGDAELEIVILSRRNTGNWKLDAFDWHGNHLTGFPYNSFSAPINVHQRSTTLTATGNRKSFSPQAPASSS
jgi:hypothetical protein